MRCPHFDAGRCRSCVLMGIPYARQLLDKAASVAAALTGPIPDAVWSPPFASAESGFRNKAKLVVGGSPREPVLGILNPAASSERSSRVTDLTDCGLYEPGLAAALPSLRDLLATARLLPYDVGRARGELKHVIVTHSPDGELMVRVVLRTTTQLDRLVELIPQAQVEIKGLRVFSVNLQPEHKAVLEGADEIVLTQADTLPVRLGAITLHLGTRSFFQTNTAVARGLYEQAAEWLGHPDPETPEHLLDLYCGVGGFALHLLGPGRRVTGVEISPEAVAAARRSALSLRDRGPADFVVGDATTHPWDGVDTVVVNPPRRGLGPELCTTLEASTAGRVLYSSCNPLTLARDLAALPSFTVARARLFDMFPQTTHAEVLVLLTRRG